ncbi:MAG: putative porin [Verrucomicrobiota bacterium]
MLMAAVFALGLAVSNLRADTNETDPSDPILNLFLQKGFITQSEADKARAEVQAMRTNEESELPPPPSKWKISDGIKDIEFYGDVRMRYEDRSATAPGNVGSIDLNRYRYAIRLGLRGEAFDDFYYGFRMETSSNPRSSMVTLGSSSPGPFGKSAGGIAIGQVYLGWQPESWFDFTVGKMPNPLYTTPMVWSPSINPEGLAEKFKYTVGDADFFATFAQFLYQDENPVSASGGLGFNELFGQTANNIFQVAWQGGVIYHITTNITAKVGATIYQYYGLKQGTTDQPLASGGDYGDPYVGEGAFVGSANTSIANGNSGFGTSGTLPGFESQNYPNNQVGLNDLLVLEVPFELNFKIKKFDARFFGDFAYNFDGAQRAEAAASAYEQFLQDPGTISSTPNTPASFSAFAPQTHDNKAYQVGFAIGSENSLGLVNGTTSQKNVWEVRTYWQHIEQYSLDPNLLDLDFFSGQENLQGIYVACAYGFSANFIGTFRYGYASRINSLLGTGGTGSDIPQINPIDQFQIFQADVTFRF